jgi:hypothetical protein
MKLPHTLAHALQCLLMTREKAETCMNPGSTPEEYAADEALFQALAAITAESAWSETISSLGVASFLGSPMGMRGGSRIVMNMYWLGEGMVPLAWLLGVTPDLPALDAPGDYGLVRERVPLPHIDEVAASAFVSRARLAVAPEFAVEKLTQLERDRNARAEEMRAGTEMEGEELRARQVMLSRSIERARLLAWALGQTTETPRR